MTPINIILAVLEAIGTLVSEILYAFIIKYLQKKQFSCPFDRVCINNFIFVMFMVIYMNILFYIALFLAPIPYQPAAILHGTLDLLFIGFTATTLSTFIIKYIYVFQTKHIGSDHLHDASHQGDVICVCDVPFLNDSAPK